MLESVEKMVELTVNHNAFKCEHSGRWYLREYRRPAVTGPGHPIGTYRESESFDSLGEAVDRLLDYNITWGEWE